MPCTARCNSIHRYSSTIELQREAASASNPSSDAANFTSFQPLFLFSSPRLRHKVPTTNDICVSYQHQIPIHFIYHNSDAPPTERYSPGTTPRPSQHQSTDPLSSFCLSEIQAASTTSRSTPNSGTSLFRTHIPIKHPLKSLLNASLDTILQAVSPRTLQTYLTAWKSFKTFHSGYNLTFPDFSLLTITSFISYLNQHKNLQASSIKGYLSGIQFFHKLIFGSPSPVIDSTQTSMLIKGIQRTHPTRPDARQPITLELLTKCITTIRRGYHSTNTAHTLDAMFILAFFGFLRCSELTMTSNFNPNNHPTISDLSLLDNDTISYFIKQSKTDQTRKGHFIYIFNFPSPIQPYQTLLAYLHSRNSQARSASDPLFIDDPLFHQKPSKPTFDQTAPTSEKPNEPSSADPTSSSLPQDNTNYKTLSTVTTVMFPLLPQEPAFTKIHCRSSGVSTISRRRSVLHCCSGVIFSAPQEPCFY
nr:uncharacterized protein LOC129443324 [Misgurnus anguillicaudatus]